MHIIYYCYGGTHSSPVAAAIHTGLLPNGRTPTKEEILELPWFDRVTAAERGRLFFVGRDEAGHFIYICGRGREKQAIKQAIISGFVLCGERPEELLFVDTMPAVNWIMRLGGYLSRRLGLVAVGRPLAALGAQLAVPRQRQIVQQVRDKLNQFTGSAPPR